MVYKAKYWDICALSSTPYGKLITPDHAPATIEETATENDDSDMTCYYEVTFCDKCVIKSLADRVEENRLVVLRLRQTLDKFKEKFPEEMRAGLTSSEQ